MILYTMGTNYDNPYTTTRLRISRHSVYFRLKSLIETCPYIINRNSHLQTGESSHSITPIDSPFMI